MLKSLILAPFVFSPRGRVSLKSVRPREKVDKTRLVLAYGLIGLNIFVLGWYLAGVSTYAGQGYEIKTIQTNIAKLSDENKKLTLKISEGSSLASLRDDFANSEFVAVAQPKFLQVDEFSLR